MAIVELTPFARLLWRYRLEAELKQEELAERAGLSARAISDLERGATMRPRRVTVELLADALHLTARERAALLAAVPRNSIFSTPAASRFPDWLPSSIHAPTPAAGSVSSPQELHEILEGLVGLYVEEDRHRWQVNVTMVTVSVSQLAPAG